MGCGASSPAEGAPAPEAAAAGGLVDKDNKPIVAQQIDYSKPLPGEQGEVGPLKECPNCGRTFAEHAYEKHVAHCAEVSAPRPVFDSTGARLAGTGAEEFLGPDGKPIDHGETEDGGWRKQDAEFRAEVASARG